MKVEKHKCDTCSKEVADPLAEIGWIEIESSDNSDVYVSVSAGRKRGGDATASVWLRRSLFEFCSIECLVKMLTPKKGKR